MLRRPRSFASTLSFIGLFLAAGLWQSCASSSPDARIPIDASGRHQKKIAKVVNGSDLMQAYLDEMETVAPGRPLLKVSLGLDRDRHKSYGGDYDPGTVTVKFSIDSLRGKGTLYAREERVNLESFMVGFVAKDATRDEVQEVAFKATEDKIYPYLARWVELAAIRAMGSEGVAARGLAPTLSELLEDQWITTDVKKEVRKALDQIQGNA